MTLLISDIVGRCLAACRAVLGSSKTCVLAFSLVCVSVAPASAQLERRFIRSGNKSYERADYDKASENYVKALDKNKESIEAIANMGNVLYKQDNFEAAGEIFSRLAESETDTLLKAGDYYNLGNNLFKQRRFEAMNRSVRRLAFVVGGLQERVEARSFRCRRQIQSRIYSQDARQGSQR